MQNEQAVIPSARAVRYIDKLTEKAKSDNRSKFLLGTIYWEGVLALQDTGEATRLLSEAANCGYAPARSILANMYYKGGTGTALKRHSTGVKKRRKAKIPPY